MKQYKNKDVLRFLDDMHEAGYNVEHYHGRFFWEGPAVRVSDAHQLADVIASTATSLQWDHLGFGYIVYPKTPDAGEELISQSTS